MTTGASVPPFSLSDLDARPSAQQLRQARLRMKKKPRRKEGRGRGRGSDDECNSAITV